VNAARPSRPWWQVLCYVLLAIGVAYCVVMVVAALFLFLVLSSVGSNK
jgi:uncharacterized protein YpmS